MWKKKLLKLLALNQKENRDYEEMCKLCFEILFGEKEDGVLYERKNLKEENESLKLINRRLSEEFINYIDKVDCMWR